MKLRTGDYDPAFDGLTAEDIRRIRGGAEAMTQRGVPTTVKRVVVPKKNKRGRRA